jgi:hypothetical protein
MYAPTAHNRSVYASAAPGFGRLGHSPTAHSHASLTHILPALVALPTEVMLRKALIWADKTLILLRKQHPYSRNVR